jgi:hypothetical protein
MGLPISAFRRKAQKAHRVIENIPVSILFVKTKPPQRTAVPVFLVHLLKKPLLFHTRKGKKNRPSGKQGRYAAKN